MPEDPKSPVIRCEPFPIPPNHRNTWNFIYATSTRRMKTWKLSIYLFVSTLLICDKIFFLKFTFALFIALITSETFVLLTSPILFQKQDNTPLYVINTLHGPLQLHNLRHMYICFLLSVSGIIWPKLNSKPKCSVYLD